MKEKKILLEVQGVGKSYGAQGILKGLDFALYRGERIGLMGPSGAGKSTLLNCLGGIDRPDAGRLLFQGRDLRALDDEALARLRRESIGTVFQFFHLLPTLTAAENIRFPMELQGWSKGRIEERLGQLLDEVGIGHRADAYPETLSGGEQQRVAIARALSIEPVLLLADEPTGNLDSHTGAVILDLLETLSNRHHTALVMVTHAPESTRICHRVLHLLDGRLQGESSNVSEEVSVSE